MARKSASWLRTGSILLVLAFTCGLAYGAEDDEEDGDERKKDKEAPPDIPVCSQRYGTLSVAEPEDAWWVRLGMESPEAVIKVFVGQSRCFTMLDRGKGLAAVQAERALAAGGETRVGSNVGKGQMKAADYVLYADLVNANADAGGNSIGGLLGGGVGGGAGALLGGLKKKKQTAQVTLTLVDVRSGEQLVTVKATGKKSDRAWGGAGGVFAGGVAAVGGGGYGKTEIGQVIAIGYQKAYVKLLGELQTLNINPVADNVQQAVRVLKPAKLYTESNNKSEVVRDLDPGMMLYPMGPKSGVFWKVQDELGNEGWVPSPLLELAK